jgi:serine/threonine protein kinase
MPGDIPPDGRLAHFELLDFVGGGGMGRVFRALDTRLGRTVALKVLSREQAADMETLMRFRNEARSAARLNHPGIAQVYYVGEDAGLPFIAFEFVEGVNIRDLLGQKGPLGLAEALSHTFEVAEALAQAARQNVVHRDIKPSNVLITPEGRAKLIDMGLARMQKLGTSANDLTASGVTLGTFDYISPEQARDPRNADARSDIYSLGCTLFFMLTGRPPFPEGTVLQKLLQHQEIEPPDIRQLRPDLPDEVSRLVRKMMAKEPRRRYQSTSKLIDALLSLAEQVGLRPLGGGQVAWMGQDEPRGSLLRQHVPWMAPAAALVLIVAVLQLFWASSPEEADPTPPYWAGAPEQSVADVPGLEPSPSPGALSPESRMPAPEPPGRRAEGATTGPEPAAPPTATSPDDAASPPPPPAGEARQVPQAETPVQVAKPNPLGTLVSSGDGQNGLLPESLEAGISLLPRIASGLPLGPLNEHDSAGITGAAATPAEVAEAGSLAEPAPEANKVLVVDPQGETPDALLTLSAACAAAASGDVIELRYDGPLEEEPLEVANLELTVRAAEGFHPVVAFRPSEIDPLGYPRSMFTLIGSRLAMVGVGIELDMSREIPSDTWSLVEIGQGEKVALSDCRLTIRNSADQRAAYHQDVTFFRLKAAPGTNVAIEQQSLDAAETALVELDRCLVRGEAVFLRIEDLRPVRLLWHDSLLITTEQLLVADGGEWAPLPKEAIEIELERFAGVTDGGLCQLNHGEFAPYQLPARVHSANSVFLLADGASLIEQAGVADMEQSGERVAWQGDHNVYLGFTDFWTVRHLDPAIRSEPKGFDDWRSRWGLDENAPRLSPVDPSDLPGPDRPVHSLTADDYPLLQITPVAEPDAGAD